MNFNFIREKVSGPKKRYIDDKYNLDLTYITPRIIAMAFPASGFKSIYRNKIEEVTKFLNEKHNENFLVLNLSGNKYNKSMFKGKVYDCDEWNDHHSPPLHLLFNLVEKIHDFLIKNVKNVAVINCNAGKGRTGTLICCYLLFSGKFSNPNDAFDYYSLKRFNKGLGVTNPSQKRYVNYFYDLISKKFTFYFPNVKIIKKIMINNTPYSEYKNLYPKYYIYHCNKIIHVMNEKKEIKINNNNKDYLELDIIKDDSDNDSDNDEDDINDYNNDNENENNNNNNIIINNINNNNIIINNINNNINDSKDNNIDNVNEINYREKNLYCFSELNLKEKIFGDIEIKLFTKRSLKSKKKLGRIAFNTAFLDKDLLELNFYQKEIDPYSFSIKKRVTKDYHITLFFEKNCNCLNTEKINNNNLCDNCKTLLKEEIENFNEINRIIGIYKKDINEGKKLLFGNENDDVQEILKQKQILKLDSKIDRRKFIDKNKKKCIII